LVTPVNIPKCKAYWHGHGMGVATLFKCILLSAALQPICAGDPSDEGRGLLIRYSNTVGASPTRHTKNNDKYVQI